jgi:hypothetical protein
MEKGRTRGHIIWFYFLHIHDGGFELSLYGLALRECQQLSRFLARLRYLFIAGISLAMLAKLMQNRLKQASDLESGKDSEFYNFKT